LQTDSAPEAVVTRAEAAFDQARQELSRLSVQLYRELFPQRLHKPDTRRDQSEVIRAVRDELSKNHPKPEGLVEAHRRNLDEFRRFIVEHNLLELPPQQTLVVQEMPAFKRGVTAAEYLAPGVLESTSQWRATYYVDPIDPAWDAARVESYLRG